MDIKDMFTKSTNSNRISYYFNNNNYNCFDYRSCNEFLAINTMI